MTDNKTNTNSVVYEETREMIRKTCKSHDGKFVYCAGCRDIYVMDAETGKCIRTLRNPLCVDALCLSLDGEILYSANCGYIYTWNTKTGKDLRVSREHINLKCL